MKRSGSCQDTAEMANLSSDQAASADSKEPHTSSAKGGSDEAPQHVNIGPHADANNKNDIDTNTNTNTKINTDAKPQLPSADSSHVAVAEDVVPPRKKLKSPTNSVDAGDRKPDPSPTRRPKNRHPTPSASGDQTSDFGRPTPRGRRLWQEGDPPIRPAAPQPAQKQGPRQSRRNNPNRSTSQSQPAEEEDPSVTQMLKQPETRPISQEQLVAEVKGIYAGLVMYATAHLSRDSHV